MDYQKFLIRNYKAIVGPLEVNVEKNALIPIIGVNECGKTTILQAIFSFDHYNDQLNEGRHVKDTSNLYRTVSNDAVVTAVISLDESDFANALDEIHQTNNAKAVPERDATLAARLAKYRRKRRQIGSTLAISRNIPKKTYAIELALLPDKPLNSAIARRLVTHLPYILYFDDFRDSIGEKIEIELTKKESPDGWLAIVERLFYITDPSYSVFDLPAMEERKRKTVLAQVRRRLNEALTKEWQNFRLDDTEALQISLDYEGPTDPSAPRHFLKLDVIETDINGDEHYFFVRDRSKGFFWFFNFVMKLEFNPKILDDDDSKTVYLLDEPGSYLHASAQTKLCKKLQRLSVDNRVIYCTHSHYLLDPEVIPLSSIRVADREASGGVKLTPIFEHSGKIIERRSAFQPVVDALQIKPFLLDMTTDQVVIVEGIYDYYAFEMLKQGYRFSFLPSVGADSIKFYVSLMIAWRVDYMALWDNDQKGRACHADAMKIFGDEVASQRFRLLGASGNQRLQDLFEGADLIAMRQQLGLPKEASFEKTIAGLFFSSIRADVLNGLSTKTRQHFRTVLETLLPQSSA